MEKELSKGRPQKAAAVADDEKVIQPIKGIRTASQIVQCTA